MNHKQQLQQGLQVLGLSLSTAQQLLLLEYVALLKKWNSTYNLTALRDDHHDQPPCARQPHPAALYRKCPSADGCGLGRRHARRIPTAICRPDLQITLLDSNTKKTTFLQQAVIELGLNNVTVASGRVEAMHDKKVDVVTSRAFAELGRFYCAHPSICSTKTAIGRP